MPLIRLYPNGSTAYNPSGVTNTSPTKRKETIGWSPHVSKRLKKWLYSIPIDSLSGQGYSFTLTVRDCPADSETWAKIRDNFIKRLFRSGCIRLQWLTEWQGRGVPHIHGIAYFDNEYSSGEIIRHWLQVSKEFNSVSYAQDSKPVHSVLGWLDYLAKHASRGYYHYQRSPDNVPDGWKKTGRVWGFRGDFLSRTPMEFQIDQAGFNQYRRIAKKLHHSKVRDRFKKVLIGLIKDEGKSIPLGMIKDVPPDRLNIVLRRFFHKSLFREYKYSKYALKSNDENLGRIMGVSDWIDIDHSQRIVMWLGSQGYDVHQS